MYKIYDGELFLFAVDTRYEADEQEQQGFRVVVGQSFLFPFFLGNTVGSGPGFMTDTLKKVSVFLTLLMYYCIILNTYIESLNE